MKRFLVLFVMIGLFLVPDIFAAEMIGRKRLGGLDEYIKTFSDNRQILAPNGVRIATSYTRVVEREIQAQFGGLDEDLDLIDTDMEWALASYYSPAVVQIRPAEAKVILPADNPRLSGMVLGANAYRDLQELLFLHPENTNKIGEYRGTIKFIQDRNGVTEAEIIQHYRSGIRDLITEIVNEEFNKISFTMSNDTIRKGYEVVLTHTSNNQYILEYEGIYQGQAFSGKLDPAPLETLLAAMLRDTSNFNRACVDAVRTQAALIPAVKFSDAAVNEIKSILTAFYTSPNTTTYTAVMEIYRLYEVYEAASRDAHFRLIREAYYDAVSSLNPELARRVSADASKQTSITALTSDQQRRLLQLR